MPRASPPPDGDQTGDSNGAGKAESHAVASLLGEPPRRAFWRRPLPWIGLALVALVAGGAWLWLAGQPASGAPAYATEPVRRGNLTLTVTANGTLQATRAVNIGSELSGTVARVAVDVNDRVKRGQVLVELDTAKLADQIVRSRSALAAAEAQVAQAVATVVEAQGQWARLQEVARLSGGKVPSTTELDNARAALERARAQEASARANVVSARAALATDETNRAKASIRSPIDGVVLTRNVDPGNAVAASLQAVTLFTVAEDLAQLRLQVNVDEADVGAVQGGQPASFTVSAYPRRNYPATITRVAFGSSITDNVVTYATMLDVDNRDLSLRPGMTATATIVATERRDVLLVPNTALRFTPTEAGAAPTAASSAGGIVSRLIPRGPPRTPRKPAAANASTASARQVWVLRNGAAVAVAVVPGISDGRLTEVSADGLQSGMPVITDQLAGVAK